MTERDIRVVEQMINCGLDVEGLYKSFPSFKKEDIDRIYAETKRIEPGSAEGGISINCS